MSIVVSGDTGFIGSHFLEYSNHVVKPFSENNLKEADQLLHLVGTTDNYHIFTNPLIDIETNNILLIDYLEKFKMNCPDAVFNFVSSWFVYGTTEPPFDEQSTCKPIGLYSVTKYSAELIVETYCKTFGLNYRIIRLANVVGNGDRGISTRKNALQQVIKQLRMNSDVDLYHQGNLVRDFIHVIDVVHGLDFILRQGELNEIYNLGSGISHRVGDLVLRCRELLKSESKIRFLDTPFPYSVFEIPECRLNVARLTSLGFKMKFRVDEVLENL